MKIERYGIVLEPKGDIGAIFNPGATIYEDNIYLFPRVIKKGYRKKEVGEGYENYISEIWIAKSSDGKNFKLLRPSIKPDKPYDRYGCEDARVTKLGREYFITYTALSYPAFSGRGYRIGLACTKNFKEVFKYKAIGPNLNDKDAVLFPEKINGKIALLHRIRFNIYIVYFDDIEQLKQNHDKKFWNKYLKELNKYLVLKKEFVWESKKIGPGPPPIKTKEGWLLIYHGVDKNRIYRVGVALLDLENPKKVIAKSPLPILEPKTEYERKGDMSNVVFPTGAVVKNKKLFLYYGAADKRCCLVSYNLDDLVSYLLKQN
jgi:predicted GH43/DUF377 family glycosyl hydrolase